MKGVCLAHFHFHLGHGFPFTQMMGSFKHVSTPHSSLLKVFWRSAGCLCSSRWEVERVGTSSSFLLSALIPFLAVAQTTHAFTSAMLSTLEWNPKEYVKIPVITFSNLFVASPLRHSTLQLCQKSVSRQSRDVIGRIIHAQWIAHASTQDMSTPPIQFRGVSPSDSQKYQLHLALEGTIGVPEGHVSIPTQFHVTADLCSPDSVHISSSPSDKFHWPVAEAILSKEILIVDLPATAVQGFHLRGWKDLPRAAAIIPLSSDADSSPLGVLIMGLNTRRTYDQEYTRWVDVTRSTLCAMLTATKAREEEAQRLEQVPLDLPRSTVTLLCL